MHAIHRYTVPIGEPTEITLSGNPLSVASRRPGQVDFWAEADSENMEPVADRMFVAIGTGHPLPENRRPRWYWGTAVDEHDLVWHLVELRNY